MFWNKKEKKKFALEITEQNFNDIVPKASMPVLVDFWAPWCGPCKVIGPIIEELAEEFEGRAIIAKINIDENQGLAAHFKVKSIPTLMFFDKGKYQEKFNGLVPKPNLQEIIEAYIQGNYEEE